MRNPIFHPHRILKYRNKFPLWCLCLIAPESILPPTAQREFSWVKWLWIVAPWAWWFSGIGMPGGDPCEVRRWICERNCSRALFRCAPKTLSLPMWSRQNNTTGPLVKVKGAALELVCMWPVTCFNPSSRKAGTLETPSFPTDSQTWLSVWIQISIGNVSGCFFSLICKCSAI